MRSMRGPRRRAGALVQLPPGASWAAVASGISRIPGSLRVRDSGPGFAPRLLPRVFDLFTQAERTLDRSQGGLGVGLALVKLLIELHGGTVAARNSGSDSPPGHGAEIIIHLPGTQAHASAPPAAQKLRPQPAAEAAGRPLRILVVDDNADAADSLALLLSGDGFAAHSVHDALGALDTAESFQPDVVLLDIGLPIMDGYEVARRLRSRMPARQLRIVALSGYGQQADRDRAARAGFDDYLVKPVEPATLGQFLRSLQ